MTNLFYLSDYKQQKQNSTTSKTTGSSIDSIENMTILLTETQPILDQITDHILDLSEDIKNSNPHYLNLFYLLYNNIKYRDDFTNNIDSKSVDEIYLYFQTCLNFNFDLINHIHSIGLTLNLNLTPYLYTKPIPFPTK